MGFIFSVSEGKLIIKKSAIFLLSLVKAIWGWYIFNREIGKAILFLNNKSK